LGFSAGGGPGTGGFVRSGAWADSEIAAATAMAVQIKGLRIYVLDVNSAAFLKKGTKAHTDRD